LARVMQVDRGVSPVLGAAAVAAVAAEYEGGGTLG
jgi:hypothetical protein